MKSPQRFPRLFTTLVVGLAWLAGGRVADANEYLAYFGTYTGKKSKGVYVSRFDTSTGRLGPATLAAEISSPSFLAVHPNRRFLYAVNEISEFGGKPAGAVTAFAIEAKTGRLTQIDQESSGGPGPCHLVVDRKGQTVLVANYGGGSVAALPLGRDGTLSPAASFFQHTGSSVNRSRQKEPHAHSINVDARNRFAVAADLGLDKLLVYRLDADAAKLTPNEPPFATVQAGSGPRHFAFHPSGRNAYVINELTCTVTAFRYDRNRGELIEEQTISTLPANQPMKPEFSTAEVQVHPSGKFLYGSNRGHDTIAVFSIDGKTGRLTAVDHTPTGGRTPRNFGIDPTGKFLLAANQSTDTVVVFAIDRATGRLLATGEKVEVGAPVCVKFVPAK